MHNTLLYLWQRAHQGAILCVTLKSVHHARIPSHLLLPLVRALSISLYFGRTAVRVVAVVVISYYSLGSLSLSLRSFPSRQCMRGRMMVRFGVRRFECDWTCAYICRVNRRACAVARWREWIIKLHTKINSHNRLEMVRIACIWYKRTSQPDTHKHTPIAVSVCAGVRL